MIELETAFIYPKWWSFVYIQKYIYIYNIYLWKLIPLKFGAFFVVRDSLCSPWKLIPLKLQPIFRGKKKTHVRFGKVFSPKIRLWNIALPPNLCAQKFPLSPKIPRRSNSRGEKESSQLQKNAGSADGDDGSDGGLRKNPPKIQPDL